MVTIGIAAAVIAEAPVIIVGAAVFGTAYGIASVAGFDKKIDRWTNNWGYKLIYDRNP